MIRQYVYVFFAIGLATAGAVLADDAHWSFRDPVRPLVPAVDGASWIQTPIDAFVLARLRRVGLEPNKPASRERLIRRAFLDLTGLLPEREEVAGFVGDQGPDPWARVIDRLLASPRYGERWGRHWLDLARYADSNGFEMDVMRRHAWRYRDYVIDSFNADKPYDRFLTEQLAGDELDPDDLESVVATGFCRNGPTVGNQALEKNRWDELDDVLSTTTEVLLGLTVGCARCHDHKYDPISQHDYYAMLAVFRGIEKKDRVVGTAEQRREKERIDKQILEVYKKQGEVSQRPKAGAWKLEDGRLVQEAMVANARLLFGEAEWSDYTVDVEFQKTGRTQESSASSAGVWFAVRTNDFQNGYWIQLGVSDNSEYGFAVERDGSRQVSLPRISGGLEIDRWYRLRVSVRGESIRVWLDGDLLFERQDSTHGRGGLGLGSWLTTTRWRNLRVRDVDGKMLLGEFPEPADARQPEERAGEVTGALLAVQLADLEDAKVELPTVMCVGEEGREAPVTNFFVRGDHRTPGPVVEPAVPVVLASKGVEFTVPPASAKTSTRRSTLARWITSRENPLTARVMVNRIWQYHFGRGLVETSSNFGLVGAKPTHPELLDWLAVEFIESGWSVKRMHQLIMSSSVYQQASRHADPNARKLDPEDQLWSRFPRRRVEAEVLRDRILLASGTLNLEMHGPGVWPRVHPSVIATSTTRKWPTVEQEGPEEWRRSVYVVVRRSVLLPMFEVFDVPTTTESCERRQTTTIPTQALQLMNDEFTNEQVERMALTVTRAVGDCVDRQVDEVFWRSLARAPTVDEQRDCRAFVLRQREYHAKISGGDSQRALSDLCHVMFNLNEFVYLD